MEVYGSKGKNYNLESSPFNDGANGSIYSVVGDHTKVVKIYKKNQNANFMEL